MAVSPPPWSFFHFPSIFSLVLSIIFFSWLALYTFVEAEGLRQDARTAGAFWLFELSGREALIGDSILLSSAYSMSWKREKRVASHLFPFSPL